MPPCTVDHNVRSSYTLTAGAREVIGGSRQFSYWVKLPSGGTGGSGGGPDEDDGGDIFHGPIRTVVLVCGAIIVGCTSSWLQ
jgi:hypothetical protein